jgi:hypothetical protein
MANTFVPVVIKKINFAATGEEILVFNDPDDANATSGYDENGEAIVLKQKFSSVLLKNTSANQGYFSISKGIAASASATEGVMPLDAESSVVLSVSTGFNSLRIYLADAGDVYITLIA